MVGEETKAGGRCSAAATAKAAMRRDKQAALHGAWQSVCRQNGVIVSAWVRRMSKTYRACKEEGG